ncbi:MAG: PilZ domain-containing protein [Rubrivivax sp.]|nr:PilZ domain-containing protein [Pyrinomonadaceae bacterium]
MAESFFAERRRHLRICLPFPATVEGLNEEGAPFQFDTLLDDLSAGGLYLRVVEHVKKDNELSVTARLSTVTNRGVVVRLTGKVLRVEPKPGGAFGVAMRIEERLFI